MGNQMFMYAAGLSAAERLNTPLRFGAWDFDRLTRMDRPWLLSCFPAITEANASFSETWNICPRLALLNHLNRRPIKKYHLFRYLTRKFVSKFIRNVHTYEADYVSYSPEFENIPDNMYITGYFESEKVFAGIKDIVRKKFEFAPKYFNLALLEKVKSCNSVALHVRMGDKVFGKKHYASDSGYIRKAAEKISGLTESPKFFVFSDDIAWCRENLPQIYDTEYTFIDGQTEPQDMALMTKCKHVIMGPSTFSWWGAWLNDNPDKIIISPDVNLWYKQYNPEDSKYLLPDEWIKIS